MAFSARFPRTTDKSVYPRWEEIYLTDEQEARAEELARKENSKLMKECIGDAKSIFSEEGLKDFQTNVIRIAVALFEKRASHSVYFKERKAKELFDKQFQK